MIHFLIALVASLFFALVAGILSTLSRFGAVRGWIEDYEDGLISMEELFRRVDPIERTASISAACTAVVTFAAFLFL